MDFDVGKLFIGGVSWETTGDKLREYFRAYGSVEEAVIMKDRLTGRGRGFGFVIFADPAVADQVVARSQKHVIDGRSVEVKKAIPREEQRRMSLSKPVPKIGFSPFSQFKTKKIFVGGLANSVKEGDMRNYFSQFGTVTDAVVMCAHDTQKPRGFGFITFDSEDSAELALGKHFHSLNENERMVEVKRAIPKIFFTVSGRMNSLFNTGSAGGNYHRIGFETPSISHPEMYGGQGYINNIYGALSPTRYRSGEGFTFGAANPTGYRNGEGFAFGIHGSWGASGSGGFKFGSASHGILTNPGDYVSPPVTNSAVWGGARVGFGSMGRFPNCGGNPGCIRIGQCGHGGIGLWGFGGADHNVGEATCSNISLGENGYGSNLIGYGCQSRCGDYDGNIKQRHRIPGDDKLPSPWPVGDGIKHLGSFRGMSRKFGLDNPPWKLRDTNSVAAGSNGASSSGGATVKSTDSDSPKYGREFGLSKMHISKGGSDVRFKPYPVTSLP